MRDASDKVLAAMIASADDSNAEVRDQVLQSLRLLASKDLEGVINALVGWLQNHKPTGSPAQQREVLLRSLHEILKAHVAVGTLPGAILDNILKACLGDMLATSELNNTWPQEACSLFVHTCDLDPHRGMPMLIENVPTAAGSATPFYILRAITDFASVAPLRIVPHLKELLKRLVPLLGSIKQENPRMLFAQTLRAVAQAVIQLDKNKADENGAAGELTPRSAACADLDSSAFAEVLNTACSHLIQEWSRVSEARVRGPVLAAITTMSAVLDEESRVKIFPQVVTLTVAGVKREKPGELATVCEGAASICELLNGDNIQAAAVQQADAMLLCISQACAQIEADKTFQDNFTSSQRLAHQKLYRWAELIAGASVDAVISFAGRNFDTKTAVVKEPAFRAAIVGIIGHVVSRRHLSARLQPYKDHIIATLKVILNETDVRVKKALAVAIVAMATNPSVSFMSQVGAKDLLRFLVKCAAPGTQVASSSPEGALRDHCRASLQVLCSSQEHLDEVLTWPGIMEHVSVYKADPELLNVFPTLLRCIAPLADRVSQTDFFYVDFRVNVNMPSPGMLVAVLVAHAALLPPPDRWDGAAHQIVMNALTAMEFIAPLLDEPFLHQHLEEVPTPIATLWHATLPELKAMAQSANAGGGPDGETALDPVEWEDLLTKLVSRTVSARPEAEWVEAIASSALQMLPVILALPSECPQDNDSAACSQRCCRRDDLFRTTLGVAGAALAKSPRRDLVAAGLDAAIDAADPDRAAHRAGVARFLSAVCTNKEYVDIVMERLASLSRPPPEKKGFFASLVGKKDGEKGAIVRKVTDRSRAMSALGLCHCARRMPAAALASRLEASIAPLLQTTLSEAPSTDIKAHILDAMQYLAPPLTKLSQNTEVPPFKAREPILLQLLDVAKGMTEAANGAKDPTLLLKTAVQSLTIVRMMIVVMPNLPLTVAVSDRVVGFLASTFVETNAIQLFNGNAAAEALLVAALELYGAVVDGTRAALRQTRVDDAIEPYLSTSADAATGKRLRSVTIVVGMLKLFLERAHAQLESEGASCSLYATAGQLMAVFVPRIFDPEVTIRKLALEALACILKMEAFANPANVGGTEGDVGSGLEAVESLLAELKTLKPRIIGVDLTATGNRVLVNKELGSLNKSLCALLVRVLPTPEHFTPLLDALLARGMRDPFADGLTTATVVLHGAIRGMGNMLTSTQAQGYLIKVVASAAHIVSQRGADDEAVLPSLFVSVKNLVKHHTIPCFDALVKKHEPVHGEHVIRAVQAVAGDATLQRPFLNYCIDALLNWPLCDEKGAVSPTVLSACCCIGWMASVNKCEELLMESRSTLLCVLALFGSAVDEKNATAGQTYVGEATRLVVQYVSSDVTKDRFERYGWAAFRAPGQWYPSFAAAVTETIKYWNDEDNLGEELTTDNDRTLDFQSAAEGGGGLLLPPSTPSQTIVDIAEFIVPYAEKPVYSQRRVATQILARALLRHAIGDPQLVQCLVTALLGRTGPDERPELRLMSLTAFGSYGLLAHDDGEDGGAALRAFLGPVTTAVLNNLDDDRQAGISYTATEVMRELMLVSDKTHLQQGATVNIMLKVKARFEHPDPGTRAAVVRLFRTVLELGLAEQIDRSHPLQQAHQHFVVMMAHAQEDDEAVRVASRRAVATSLRLMARTQPPEVAAAVDRLIDSSPFDLGDEAKEAKPTLLDEATLHDFGKLWVTHFAGRVSDLFAACIAFFDAPPPALRLAAASVAAVVLKHLPPAEFDRTNAEQLVVALTRLTKAGSAELRMRAVKALGSLPLL